MSAQPTAIPQTKLAAALEHAAAGRAIFPCWPPRRNGKCDCGKPDCENVGKHPIGLPGMAPHGVKDAATDPAIIRGWWKRYPYANIAWAPDESTLLLDVDPRHDGGASLAKLERQHGRLPETVEAISGSGGRHIVFALPAGVHVGNKVAFAGGLDTRTAGGYVIAAGSTHESGGRYEWDGGYHPDETSIAIAPAWLLAAIAQTSRRDDGAGSLTTADMLAGVGEGQRDKTLFDLTSRLHRAGVPQDWATRLVEEAAANCAPAYSAAKAREKVARVYQTYTPPPPPTIDDLDDPTDDCPRCARFREMVAELRTLPVHLSAALRGPEVAEGERRLPAQERIVNVAAAFEHFSRKNRVEVPEAGAPPPVLDDGSTLLRLRDVAHTAGCSEQTASRALRRSKERRQCELRKESNPTTGYTDLYFKPAADTLPAALQLIAGQKSGRDEHGRELRPWGGLRTPRCPDHPHAAVIPILFACTECGQQLGRIRDDDTTTDIQDDGWSPATDEAAAATDDDPTPGNEAFEPDEPTDYQDAPHGYIRDTDIHLDSRSPEEEEAPETNVSADDWAAIFGDSAQQTTLVDISVGGISPTDMSSDRPPPALWKVAGVCLDCGGPLPPGAKYRCAGCVAFAAIGGAR